MPTSDLPSFERPPVVETVLGVQFNRLPRLMNVHLGAYWRDLGSDWPNAKDAPLIEEARERMGPEPAWLPRVTQIQLTQLPQSRCMIKNRSGDRMIQVQNGRFHVNWLGHAGDPYPRYSTIRPEFDRLVSQFRRFVTDNDLGDVQPNQWEVTYVNHLPKGELWSTAAEWGAVVSVFGDCARSGRFEGFDGEFHYRLPDDQGRLHVRYQHALEQVGERREVLMMQLTARGPVEPSEHAFEVLGRGLDAGRRAIVLAFASMTTEKAHAIWRLKK